jgi:tetratricopeptide (TPR) repeat protein
MARLRERIDDYPEAERLYASAIALNGFAAEALARRAALRRELGRDAEALQDLEAAVQAAPETPEYLERLARWYVADHNWSAALAANRRLETVLGKTGDAARAAQVHLQVLALAVLAGETDPVSAGRESPSWVRRSLAEISSH